MNSSQPWRVWCLVRNQEAYVKPVEAAFGHAARFIYDTEWNPARLLAQKPDVVLCINDYPYDLSRCLDAARSAWIPSLVLQDGILEWRCQYENPLFGAGGGAPQHQPVLADKIACLGRASARHIAAWGNAAKVEVTGMPRLDCLLERRFKPIRKPGTRILIMTAKNPGFTPEQRELALRALREVKNHLESRPGLELNWRVSRSVADTLGVTNQLKQIGTAELVEGLEQVDAVISTPSTAMLEAMLLGRPVAMLDYPNTPRFQQTAWAITAREQIAPVVEELLHPPADKLTFQQACLADGLDCAGPASQRVRELMEKMIAATRNPARDQASLPPNLLERGPTYRVFPPPALSELYPDAAVFQAREVEQLQVRLARAENENLRLKAENQQLRAERGLRPWLRNKLSKWHF